MNRTNLVEDFTLLAVPPWWQSPIAIVLMLLAAVLVALLVRWVLKRMLERKPTEPGLPPVPDLHASFLERLARLRAQRASMDGYALAIATSELLREYVEWRFRIRILFQTTREFLDTAAVSNALDSEQRARLGKFLEFCDRVKFARQQATTSEGDGLLDAAESMIRSGQAQPGGES